MALRAVVLCYMNAHPQGPTGATLTVRTAYFEDGFGDLADFDIDVDFALPAAILSTITNSVIARALDSYGKTLLATNIFIPMYQKGSLV